MQSINAQELPPEPDMQDVFGELDPELNMDDVGGDEIAPPPPLPVDMVTESVAEPAPLEPAAEIMAEDEFTLPDAEMPELGAPEVSDDSSFSPEMIDDTDPFAELEASAESEEVATDLPKKSTNIAAPLTPEQKEQYEELKKALFDFLGREPSKELSAGNEQKAPIEENIADLPAKLNAEEPLALDQQDALMDEALGGMPEDDILDAMVGNDPLAEPSLNEPAQNPVVEMQPAPPVQPVQQEVMNEPAAPVEVPVEAEVTQAPAKKTMPVFKQPEEPVREALPAYSKDEEEFIDQVDKQSQSLPNFAKLSEEEKNALQKPMEELARAQKEKELERALPPEKEELIKGDDLSALPADDSGDVHSEEYDLKVSNEPDDQDRFLSTDIQLEMAYRALLSGQLEAAIDIYKTVMENHPDNQTAMFGLASAYQKNNQIEQAKSLYQELLAVSPSHKEALNNYLVLMAQEAPEDALLQLQKLERVSPYYSPIPAQIGMVYYKMGQYVQAERYLRKAISMAPENLSYLYNLAIISDHLGKVEQSISLYEKLLNENKKGHALPGAAEHIAERLEYLRHQATK